MIQGIITRMSGYSATAKTFTITILAGLAAISLQADAAQLGLIAMIAALPLFLVDTYYMTLEVGFRRFYDEVAERDLDQATNLAIVASVSNGDIKKAIKSKANLLFYVPVAVACAFFIWYGLANDERSEQLPRTATSSFERPTEVESSSGEGAAGRVLKKSITTTGLEGAVGVKNAAEQSGHPSGASTAGNTTR
jgi:hypothetical protein